MNILGKAKAWFEQRQMKKMERRMTKYIQKREKRRVLMEREILTYIRRQREKVNLNQFQSLKLAEAHFRDELTKERMKVTRDRAGKSLKVILA